MGIGAGVGVLELPGPDRSAHILAVDDDPAVRQWLVRVLEPRGFEVSVAADGREALAVLERELPDLILTDVHMPDIDGYRLVTRVRMDTRLSHIPVILISGSDESPFKVLGLDCGANDYITKPVDSAELLARVRAQLRQLRTYAALEKQALIDDLTGVFNRRGVIEALTRALARWRRCPSPLSVLVADINAFKRINDTLGHIAGDAVLREVAAALADVVRVSDTVGRLGGDEFLLVLPDTSVAEADQIRSRACAAASLNAPDRSVGRVSIAAGIAVAGPDTPHIDALIDAADRDMYAHKRASNVRSGRAPPSPIGSW